MSSPDRLAGSQSQEQGQGHAAEAGAVLSRTSQAVALTRAALARPHTPGGDPQAQQRLCAGMASVTLPDHVPSLAARTRFFDDQVLAAISAGVRQVVILGAGYDDRALRFRSPGVRFFEIDHPVTQADKASRLRAMGAGSQWHVLAAADFRQAGSAGRGGIVAVLAEAGHDAASSSLFACEGLLVYLDEPDVLALLAGLRAAATTDSALAVSFATHAEGMDSRQVAQVANARRRTGRIEPWRTILPASAQLAMLSQAGWDATDRVDAATLGTGAIAGRSLLVTAQPGQPGSGQPGQSSRDRASREQASKKPGQQRLGQPGPG